MFQQDSDLKQASKVLMEWLNQARIEVLEWPFQSPGLILIENMETVPKKQNCARKLKNVLNFTDSVTQEWSNIQLKDDQKLVNGYQKCMIKVKMAK